MTSIQNVKEETGLLVLSDVHEISQMEKAAKVLDVIQIPAFLCRQTDLLLTAARTGLPINIKKGQFLSPWEIEQAILKATSTENRNILITERGTSFGHNNLVVDIRSIAVMKGFGFPVIFDATNLSEYNREQLYRISDRAGAKIILVRIEAPAELVHERLQIRKSIPDHDNKSDADWAVYKKMKPAVDLIKRNHFVVDTSRDIHPVIKKIIREIHR